MEKEQVKEMLIEVLNEIQEVNGQPNPNISDDTRPMSDLTGFDSLNLVEASVILSERLGCEIKSEVFLQTPQRGELTVKKITDRIEKILNEG